MSSENFVNLNNLDENIQQLIRECVEARKMSYSPYSKFSVGAALRCNDGTIFRGCNIENSSYPVTLCAERTAVSKAISEGKKNFQAIAVSADLVHDTVSSPCGMCRQFLSEFGNMDVYLTNPTMDRILHTSVMELLPLAFKF
ncbi:cytidine deaminase-like [Chelonus insularis]|uniref:cytidine deaminase-like n=1 Tax=Chelonus insularis TaxID=460826 RepID=UPI00158E3719|nr:cytidine deaminase-like [Chelonus insularis]